MWEQPWPQADTALLTTDEIQLIVQLNGKLIDRLMVPASASREELEEHARASERLELAAERARDREDRRGARQARELRGPLTAAVRRSRRALATASPRRPRRSGRELARAGAVLVCGGLGGAMEAACRGAKAEGGTTLGILPGADRAAANPYVDVAVATGLGEARNALVVRAADAVIAVAGGYGTLSEIALALRAGKPVVGLRDLGDRGRASRPASPAERRGLSAGAEA